MQSGGGEQLLFPTSVLEAVLEYAALDGPNGSTETAHPGAGVFSGFEVSEDWEIEQGGRGGRQNNEQKRRRASLQCDRLRL